MGKFKPPGFSQKLTSAQRLAATQLQNSERDQEVTLLQDLDLRYAKPNWPDIRVRLYPARGSVTSGHLPCTDFLGKARRLC